MATKHSIDAALAPKEPQGAPAPDETSAPTDKPQSKGTTRAKGTRTQSRKGQAKASPAKRTPPKKAPEAPKKMDLGDLVGGMVKEAEAHAQGTVQIAVRIPPSTKQRLKESMSRAGLVQEKFVAELIKRGLDELDEVLAARDTAEK